MLRQDLKPIVDMHIHTTYSDGTYSPKEVVKRAIKAGVCGIAVTDHDAVDGIKDALKFGRKYGIRVLPGVELSVDYYNNTHILGYFPKGFTAEMAEKIEALKEYRKERISEMLVRLKKIGCSLSMRAVLKESSSGAIGRPHFAMAMVRKGYVNSVSEAFIKYLSSDGPVYVPKKKLKPREVFELIGKNHGVSVLAHPFSIEISRDMLVKQVRAWMEEGLDGIETINSDHSPAQIKFLENLADKLQMLKTGGSDFHGQNRPGVVIGWGRDELYVPVHYFDAVYTKVE